MSNTPYKLEYTAEQINHRLDLINENKNLLPYQYDSGTTFPTSLEDVGDGSFLTTGETTSNAEIYLNNCSLLAGTYTASLEVTDITDSLEIIANPGFSLKIVIDGTTQPTSFTLSTTKVASIYLVVPEGCSTKNLLIKPQIEAGAEKTDWVPYMDTIGNYVDERFNSTNAKIKVLASQLGPLVDLIESIEEE